MFKVANITSFAMKPVATPGNSTVYGTEFNGDLGYSSHRLFAGFSYGVLFPFVALLIAYAARAVLPGTMPGAVFKLAVPILLSLALIRLCVRVLSVSFHSTGMETLV